MTDAADKPTCPHTIRMSVTHWAGELIETIEEAGDPLCLLIAEGDPELAALKAAAENALGKLKELRDRVRDFSMGVVAGDLELGRW